MTDDPVCLTLVIPRKLRDDLFDYLSERTELVSGFTASEAAGHGPDVHLHSAAERVKGHADQILVRMILPGTNATRLIEQLRLSFAGTRLVYWIGPVTQFGVIA